MAAAAAAVAVGAAALEPTTESSATAAAQKAATQPSIPLPPPAAAAAAAGDGEIAPPNLAAGVVGAVTEARSDDSVAPAAAAGAAAAAGQVNGGDALQAQPEELHEVEEGGGEAGRTAAVATSVSVPAVAAGVGGGSPAGERDGAKTAVPRGGMEDWDPAVLERWGRAALLAVLVLYGFALSFADVYAMTAVFFVVSDAGWSFSPTTRSRSVYYRSCCSALDSSSRDPFFPRCGFWRRLFRKCFIPPGRSLFRPRRVALL